jgi:Family of unknown function (DUF6130)
MLCSYTTSTPVRDQWLIAPQIRFGIHCTKVSADTFVQSTGPAASGEIEFQIPRTQSGRNENPIKTLAVVATGALLATSAFVQGAASLAMPIEKDPAPKLFIEPPLPGPLASSVTFIPYRVESLRILPVGGPGARNVSPRVGHVHITLDDLPWQWTDYGQSNTSILVNLRAANTRC